MKAHFIAIGGSAMHNLAIALHLKGVQVTGSDDEIFDPAKSRLEKYGLLPKSIGWDPDRITKDLDAVVLGMHARQDNPELIRAQELGIKIFSYPEYLYEQSKDKTRIVIGGSHGKTTTTAMILHVLQHCGVEADYMVGAQLEGFEVMVRLSETAKVMVIEGDEYLTSPIDRRPKFHLYKPNVAIITGIEWDHINVFPTFEIYKDQFAQFIDLIMPNGTLIYCDADKEVRDVAVKNQRQDLTKLPYAVPEHVVETGITSLVKEDGRKVPLSVFGQHNLMNMTAARLACKQIGITDEQFDEAIQSFGGASKRLELVKRTSDQVMYKDFAHAPSKLRATISAMKEQYAEKPLIACMELHTFSSLTAEFLKQYKGCMDKAEVPIVYFNPHAVAHKKLPPLTTEQVYEAFANNGIKVFNDSQELVAYLHELMDGNRRYNLLMMSSGNFDGIDFAQLAEELIREHSMTETQNIIRTGKVTISRKSKNSMRKDMLRSIYRYLLLAIPLGILIAFLNPAVTTLIDWSIAIVSALFAALLFWLGGIMVNRGSMVESLCFDYDNQVLKLKRTDFRNRQGRMEIPFEDLSVSMMRGFFERRDRAFLYSKKMKMAVLVFSFGWEDSAYDKVKYQLEAYLADKMR